MALVAITISDQGSVLDVNGAGVSVGVQMSQPLPDNGAHPTPAQALAVAMLQVASSEAPPAAPETRIVRLS